MRNSLRTASLATNAATRRRKLLDENAGSCRPKASRWQFCRHFWQNCLTVAGGRYGPAFPSKPLYLARASNRYSHPGVPAWEATLRRIAADLAFRLRNREDIEQLERRVIPWNLRNLPV